MAVLREVHYLKRHEELLPLIPETALQIYEKEDTFRQYTINLNITIEWYNKIRKNSQKVEFDLVREEIQTIDEQIQKGRTSLNWNSDGCFYSTFMFEH